MNHTRTAGAAIEVRGVTVSFGGLTAVDDVSIQVESGARVGLIGPNGAGKSTLFKAIAGEIGPSKGSIWIDSHNVSHASQRLRAKLGFGRTFQITNLLIGLTCVDNARLADRNASRRPWGGRKSNDDFRETLASFGIGDHLIGRRVATLGYGEQRRLELALAVLSGSRCLLLDEPAAGLGPEDRAQLAHLVGNVPHDTTVLLVEHDIDLTLGLVDRVICLENGRLIADIPADEVRGNDAVRRLYLGVPDAEEGAGRC